MKHLYLFTLEVEPLEVGRVYDELPSHLTLMSRFLSDLSPEELAATVHPLLTGTPPICLVFGKTVELGPKKVTAYMVSSPDELRLHYELRKALDTVKVEYQYPEFMGVNHRPHVTEREGVQFKPGWERLACAAYLIEVVKKKRIVCSKFEVYVA